MFDKNVFRKDRRFTVPNNSILTNLVIAIPSLSRLMPKADMDSRLVMQANDSLKTGTYFNGHSSSVLMEKSLGLPANTISRTYKWPGKFSQLDPIELDKEVSAYMNGALDYARVRQGNTLGMTQSRIKIAENEGAHAYTKVCALNDILVQLNPELVDARNAALKARHYPNGLIGEVHFLAGAKFRKHPDDILHFIQDSTGLMSAETAEHHRTLSNRLMAKAERYTPPDIGCGWIMCPSVAKLVAERLVDLAKQGIEPKPRLYWAQQSVLKDQKSSFINKLKALAGLTPKSSTLVRNDGASILPGYDNIKQGQTTERNLVNQVDKELLNVAQLLGVHVDSFPTKTREIRIETPSVPFHADSEINFNM